MGYSLRYQQGLYSLSREPFIVGREDDCQLCLSDPLTSRRHARFIVEGERVLVEDLESRNGVFVNAERIVGRAVLSDGDRISIGDQILVVERKNDQKRETMAGTLTTGKIDSFGVLGGLAEKAIAMGRGDEAERIIGRVLKEQLALVEAGESLPVERLEKASSYALSLAELQKSGAWLDYVFLLHK
ncbi:MAG: FHA domain-containing protein, partial [Polyangiaceae bacterium]|nr:FHA domain-containing protein [Polyangiaceae bacterium]